MTEGKISSIAISGAGNVGTQLAKHFHREGIHVKYILSRTFEKAEELAILTSAQAVRSYSEIEETDLILLCIPDDKIAEELKRIPDFFSVAYTAGSIELGILPPRKELGVFYPLQTFSKGREINLFEVPFLIESGDTVFSEKLFNLAWVCSRKVQFASSAERKHIHLSAVLINNFTNHLAYLSEEFMKQHNLDWNLMKPLLKETVDKLNSFSPYDAQTGPARRNDREIIKEHITMLEGTTREIYRILSESILTTYLHKDNDKL